MEEVVIIVGAGPAGLATSACLKRLCVPNIILERENCCASLWKKNSYDILHLHIAKEFCSLPYMSHINSTPTYMPKEYFIKYIDTYVSNFNISPLYNRSVDLAVYDENANKWRVEAKNTLTGNVEVYLSQFLVVATGENSEGVIPNILGLENFKGEILHSQEYKSGKIYQDKKVLVIGCGNSGMEIAYDLATFNVDTSIVIRSPIHVLTEEIVHFGMLLLKNLPVNTVDEVVTTLAKFKYGDLSKYGIHQPTEGPFSIKASKKISPVIDTGAIRMIQEGKIKVFPGISRINENSVAFENGAEKPYDVLIFATGFRSTANKWLKDFPHFVNDNGMPTDKYPSHWKGEKGLYWAGFGGTGLPGISKDAKAIADDISSSYEHKPGATVE